MVAVRIKRVSLFKTHRVGTSVVVQWLRLHAPNAGGLGSIPGRGTGSQLDPTCPN